jgi:GGDEF domain-containing protein
MHRVAFILALFIAGLLGTSAAWASPGGEPEGGVDFTASGAIAPAGISFEEVRRGRVVLPSIDPNGPHALGPGRELWLRLDLRDAGGGVEPAMLVFPTPIVDYVEVHQRGRDGRWTSALAGDRVPQDAWPVRGRYPAFPVHLDAGGQAQVFVQVRHATVLTLPVAALPQTRHQQRSVLEHLAFGAGLGAVALLIAHCVLRAWRLRDGNYLVLGSYAALSLSAVGAATGVAGHLVWGGSGRWVDIAPGFLTLLAAGAATFITSNLTAAVARMPRLARLLAVLGWASVPLALAYALLQRAPGLTVLGAYVLVISLLAVLAATLTWRRGDVVGVWMLLGALPLIMAVVVTLGRSLGLIEASWLSDYGLVAAFVLGLPMLLGALNNRSRDRRSAQLRVQAAGHRDPLTGLARSNVFYARVLHALRRFAAHREPTAVAMLEIANLKAVQASRGEEAVEECLLRSVIKMRALLRDVDTAARLGDARFGVLLEGVATRERAGEFATRLVAAGLMDEQADPSAVPLRFHVVITLLNEYAPPAEQLLRDMAAMLSAMGPRTRRPIRFLTAAELPIGVPASDGLDDSALEPVVH